MIMNLIILRSPDGRGYRDNWPQDYARVGNKEGVDIVVGGR